MGKHIFTKNDFQGLNSLLFTKSKTYSELAYKYVFV